MYLIKIKPPINKIVNAIANKLKYFSMNFFIGSPNTFINVATIKNRALRLIIDATTNIKKLMLNVPADIVINLNGIGVNPAVKTIKKSHRSYIVWILLNPSIVIPGTYSKNILAM